MNLRAEIKKVIDNELPTKAIADVVIDDSVVIHGVKLIETDNGRFVAMPATSWTNIQGEVITRDSVHPISSSARKAITDAAFGAFDTYKINNLKN